MKFNRLWIGIILFFFIIGTWYIIDQYNFIDEIFGFLLKPLWKSVSFSGREGRSFFENYLFLVNLKQENQRLKQEILILKSKLAKYEEREKTYEKLEKFFKISSGLSSPKVAAQIIYKPLDPFSGIIFIDKGRDSGIMPQMPVLANAGGKGIALIGQVVEVYKNWSKVILLTHPTFSAAVKDIRTGDRGILRGNAEEYCYLRYLISTAHIKPGDEIITSGEDALFPKGLLVGKVISVGKDSSQVVFKMAKVKPLVDFCKLDTVFVLLKPPEIPLE